jgi:hypothetical protein
MVDFLTISGFIKSVMVFFQQYNSPFLKKTQGLIVKFVTEKYYCRKKQR